MMLARREGPACAACHAELGLATLSCNGQPLPFPIVPLVWGLVTFVGPAAQWQAHDNCGTWGRLKCPLRGRVLVGGTGLKSPATNAKPAETGRTARGARLGPVRSELASVFSAILPLHDSDLFLRQPMQLTHQGCPGGM